jgi:carbon-monoxide dehydrogenase medium subunit
MIPPFLMLRPDTVEEALGLADQHGEAARYYAGGTELLLVMREGFLDAEVLIDLKRIGALSGTSVDEADGTLRIGAASTHSDIERSPVVQTWMPELARLSGSLANLRVRNTGTLGGNLCFAEPHGDPATLLMAADGRVILQTPEGSREVDLEHFIVGPFEVNLAPSELMTEIRIPLPALGSRFGYSRFRALERPSIGVAVRLDLPDGRDTVADARVVVGCAGPRPQRILEAERLLKEAPRSNLAEVARTAGVAASDEVDVDGDAYGPEDYKRNLAGVLVRRPILAALDSPPAHPQHG